MRRTDEERNVSLFKRQPTAPPHRGRSLLLFSAQPKVRWRYGETLTQNDVQREAALALCQHPLKIVRGTPGRDAGAVFHPLGRFAGGCRTLYGVLAGADGLRGRARRASTRSIVVLASSTPRSWSRWRLGAALEGLLRRRNGGFWRVSSRSVENRRQAKSALRRRNTGILVTTCRS